MTIAQLMTKNPETAQAGDTLRQVAARMESGNFGSVPILDGERLAGVVTDRDIAVRGVAQGLSPDEPISKVMSPDPVCVGPDCEVQEAAQLMQDRQIRRLYVTDDDSLVGVVALADLVGPAGDKLSGQTIEKISES
jgi:CBS domain-containing protein